MQFNRVYRFLFMWSHLMFKSPLKKTTRIDDEWDDDDDHHGDET